MNLAQILFGASREHAGRPALHHSGAQVTFDELERRTRVAAARLHERGVGADDRIALKLPNGPEFAAAWFGALQLGAIVVPLNVLLARPEIEERIRISGAMLLVDDPSLLDPGLEPMTDVAERSPTDPAVILFTSGTSGRAKGAVLTHGGIRFAARAAADALALRPDDVVLGAAPFSTSWVNPPGSSRPSAGASIAVVERFEAEATLRWMTDTRTTILLRHDASRCASGSRVLNFPVGSRTSGAPVPLEVARTERTFGGEGYEGYGLTELSGIGRPTSAVSETWLIGCCWTGQDADRGRPRRRATREQRGGGVRGPSVIRGYWEDEQSTASVSGDGWLRTGDIGHRRRWLPSSSTARADVIIRGGYNVYPREVEEVLYTHPDVLEVAVVGVAHPTLGEEVAALVVGRAGSSPDPDALRAYAKGRVAAYKYPRHVVLVDELPSGPTGKILRREIDVEALLGDASSSSQL
jgi:long-chain acyl-CoA synthetase